MFRTFLIAVVLLSVKTVSAGEFSELEKKEVMSTYNAFVAAYRSKDYTAAVELVYEPIVRMAGGRDKFMDSLTLFNQLERDGTVEILSMEAQEPTELISAGDSEVCFIPTNIVMSLNGERIRDKSFTVAVRKKGETSWKLIGGSGFRKHPEQLAILLPGLPDSTKLPINVLEKIDASGKPIQTGNPSAEQIAKQIARRQTFPIRVDEITQLDSINGSGDELIYSYSLILNDESDATIKGLLENMPATTKARVCKSQNSLSLLGIGVSLVFKYSTGKPGQEIRIVLKAADCKT